MKILCVVLGLISALYAQDDAKRVTSSNSGQRLALVIGNAAYEWKPLTNSVNDATDVAQTLEGLGFASPKLVTNAGRDDLRRAVRDFIESVRPGDFAFVYYSGHGIEIRGENYLLPVDLPGNATEGYVQDEAVSAQRILRDLSYQGARIKVLILDACRDNPLRATKSRAGGLARMDEGSGDLIVFATQAGKTASDAPLQRNSLFTRYLLNGLRLRGISLDDAMKSVSRRVAAVTKERQVPAIYGLLLEDVILSPGRSTKAPPASAGGLPPAPLQRSSENDATKPSERKAGEIRINPGDGERYVWIPPGEFQMGCSPDDTECDANEEPTRRVRISRGFWLGQTEVTQAPYQKLIGKNPSHFKGSEYPVQHVNWNEALRYCNAAGGRLPTEAEWEYAARAGSKGARHGELYAIGWYKGNSEKTAHPVKQKQPNSWGLYDMLGNVWEWVNDFYDEDYYKTLASPISDPSGPSGQDFIDHVLRGGSWFDNPKQLRASHREGTDPGYHLYDISGFRCARDLIR
jgi:formylglycine-generating enzyme required for sulfatase activity